MTVDDDGSATPEQEWKHVEEQLLQRVQSDIDTFERTARVVRRLHRAFGVVAIVSAALAPLFVLGAGQNASIFGIDTQTIGQIALLLTVLTAIAEGLRRFYAFDYRWRSTIDAKISLQNARDGFREARIGLVPGSPGRVAAYQKFRDEWQRVTRREAEEFFQTVTAANVQQPPGAKE